MPLFMLMAAKTTEWLMSEVNIHNVNYFKGAHACALAQFQRARTDATNAIKELVMSVEGQKIEGLHSRTLSYDFYDWECDMEAHYVVEALYYNEEKGEFSVKLHGYDGIKIIPFAAGCMSNSAIFSLLELCIKNVEENNLKFAK